MFRLVVVAVTAQVLCALAPRGEAAERGSVFLNLVLALDVSASVNDQEYALQRRGTAFALRDRQVQAAIARAPGGVNIAVIQWSSITQQAVGVDWTHVDSASRANAVADRVDNMARRLPGGNTMIHAGLAFAGMMLHRAPAAAQREVIDVSGNGEADDVAGTEKERDRLVARGIAINGLAIEEDPGNITAHFHRHVIGGPGAFVITAVGFGDFARAMRVKLLREIQRPIAMQDHRTMIGPGNLRTCPGSRG